MMEKVDISASLDPGAESKLGVTVQLAILIGQDIGPEFMHCCVAWETSEGCVSRIFHHRILVYLNKEIKSHASPVMMIGIGQKVQKGLLRVLLHWSYWFICCTMHSKKKPGRHRVVYSASANSARPGFELRYSFLLQ